MGILSRESTVH